MSRAFTGSDYLEMSSNGGLPTGNGVFSITMWYYPTVGTSGDYGALISWGTTGTNNAFIVAQDGDSIFTSLRLLLGRYANNILQTSADHILNAWNSCVVTYDGSTITVYVNGVNVGSASVTLTTASGTLRIGDLIGGGQPFHGYIGEVSAYDVVLTAEEAMAFNHQSMLDRPTMWYFPLYGDGSTEPDYSGNANSITIVGTSKANHALATYEYPWSQSNDDAVSVIIATASGTLTLFQSAGNTSKHIYILSGTTFTAPSDWPGTADQVECIGAGAGGLNAGSDVGKGGGGGGYSSKFGVTINNGDNLQVGQGGGPNTDGTDTWIGGTDFASSSCGAKGGIAGGLGGQASDGIGDTTFSGGAGGGIGSNITCGAGGGSAAGPLGPGGDGADGGGVSAAAGGGGTGGPGVAASGSQAGDGGIGSDGTAGGLGGNAAGQAPTAGSHGSGGGGGASGSETGADGGSGVEWFDILPPDIPSFHGAGGGGGGSDQNVSVNHFGGNGGSFGGGGGGEAWSHQSGSSAGTGANGIIRITYTPVITPIKTASNTITFSQVASTHIGEVEIASNTITFSGTAHGFSGTKHVTAPFTITSAVVVAKISNVSGSSILSMHTVADVVKLDPASNSLTFSQEADVTVSLGTSSTITLTQSAIYNYTPHFALPSNTLVFAQALNKSVSKTVPQTFTISQVAVGHRVKDGVASNLFIMASSVSTAKVLGGSNTLSFSQSAVVHKLVQPNVSNTLVFVQSVSRTTTLNLGLTSSLTFLHVYQKQTNIQGIHFYTPVPEVIVTKSLNRISFRTTDRAIILLPPELGDGESPTNKIVLQRTITGGTYVYARRTTTRRLKYTFETDQFKALEMRRFMLDCLSSPIWVENWKGELWIGYFTSNPIQLKTTGRGAVCGDRYSFDIEFEGARIH